MNRDSRKLRKKFESNEGFMNRGHQIMKVRTRSKEVPEWATDNVKTQALLLSVFPKLHTNTKQRRQAARWARVIHLYYRLGMPHNQVAEETKTGYGALRSLLRDMRRAALGFDSHKRVRGLRPRGRPKRKTAPHPPPLL